MDGGSLYQLRNLINRRNVVKDPTHNVTACEDFFVHVVEAHVLSACMTVFDMPSVDSNPSTVHFPEGSADLQPSERRRLLLLATKEVITRLVDFSFEGGDACLPCDDHVLAYAREVLSLGLLYMEFTDAVREGDGGRILRCWRYLLLIFKASNRTNYSVEAFTLLAQYHFMFSERMRMQLMWGRTVNVHGRPGKNISCDLHNEHLNRECKGGISGLGANVTDHAVERVGKALRSTVRILEQFDMANNVPQPSGYHTSRSATEDILKLVDQLHQQSHVYHYIPGRSHCTFSKFEDNLLKKLSKQTLLKWLQEQFRKLLLYR